MSLEIKKVTIFRASEPIENFSMVPVTLILQHVFTDLICLYWRMEENKMNTSI